MALACPSCGAENPEEARFCRECGNMFSSAPAAAGPPAGAPPPPPPPPPTEPVPVVPPVPPTQAMPVVPPTAPPPPPGAIPPPPGAAGPPPEKKKSKGPLFILLALLVVAALVGGFLILGGDDGGDDGDILLEPVGFALADDFFGNLDLDTPGDNVEVALDGFPELEDGVDAAGAGKTAPGDLPGLFGGNRDQPVCDVEELASQLDDSDNEEKSAAFADAVGIDIGDLTDALAGMTAVRLRFDTRVTDHGFSNGNAVPQQAILEKGTAVLVDDEGVPRVKCNGGNPLADPDSTDLSDDDALDEKVLKNPEDAWDGFDLESVVVVDSGDAVSAFTLVDLDTGELFDRPVGTNGDADVDVEDFDTVCDLIPDSPTCAEEPTTTTTEGEETTTTSEGTTTTIILGTGDVQVTLEWDSAADLDLAVTDPTGEEISFSNTGPSATGGELDVDSNVGCSEDGSVENIFWPPGAAPAGQYTAEVTGFTTDSCSQGAQSGEFVLTIRVAGRPDEVHPGSVDESGVVTFPFAVG